MPFALSPFELLAILTFVLPTFVSLAVRGYSGSRWFVAASICVVAAAVITPADLLSTAVLSATLFAVLLVGAQMRLLDSPLRHAD